MPFKKPKILPIEYKQRLTKRHMTVTMLKDKEKILKLMRKKQLITHRGTPVRHTANSASETMETRKQWMASAGC